MKKIIMVMFIFAILLTGYAEKALALEEVDISNSYEGDTFVIAKTLSWWERLFTSFKPFAIVTTDASGRLTQTFQPGDTIKFAVDHQVIKACSKARIKVSISNYETVYGWVDYNSRGTAPSVIQGDLVSAFIKRSISVPGTYTATSEIQCTDNNFIETISKQSQTVFTVESLQVSCNPGKIGDDYCLAEKRIVHNERVCPSGDIIRITDETCSGRCVDDPTGAECIGCTAQDWREWSDGDCGTRVKYNTCGDIIDQQTKDCSTGDTTGGDSSGGDTSGDNQQDEQNNDENSGGDDRSSNPIAIIPIIIVIAGLVLGSFVNPYFYILIPVGLIWFTLKYYGVI